jgi:hypothetical protein
VAISNFDAVGLPVVAAELKPMGPPGPQTAAPSPLQAGDAASWVLFVDDVDLHPAHRALVLRQLRTFLSTDLRAGDRVMVATYDHGLRIRLPFSTDRAALGRALDAVENLAGGGNELDRARRLALQHVLDLLPLKTDVGKGGHRRPPLHTEEQEEVVDDSQAFDELATLEKCPPEVAEPVKSYAAAVRHEVLSGIGALTVLVNSLSGVPGRKVLLHISDGIPLTPGEDLFQVLVEICGREKGSRDTSYEAGQAALDAQAAARRSSGPTTSGWSSPASRKTSPPSTPWASIRRTPATAASTASR